MHNSINKSKLILLIVTTIVSLLLIYMSYYGITRYIYMHMHTNISYIENISPVSYKKYVNEYKNLPKKCDTKVIISISSSNKSIYNIKPCLKSLLDQTVKVDSIILNLPPSNVEYDIPKEYKDVCKIYKSGINYGKFMNCIPTLLRELEYDTIIILLKDNVVYGKEYIETILEKSINYPDKHIIQDDDVILLKPKFIDHKNIINYEDLKKLDNNWLKRNLLSDFELIEYKENYNTFTL